MKTTIFLEKIADVLDYDGTLVSGQSLDEIELWDSLGLLSVVELMEEMGIDIDLEALATITTVDELIAIAGSVISE